MSVAKNIGRYMKEKGYNLSEVSRKTGIGYKGLYASLYDKIVFSVKEEVMSWQSWF